MRLQKLLIGITVGYLLIGAPGIAMAEGCKTGVRLNDTVENLRIDGTTCYVFDSVVNGNVYVTNSARFFMHGSRVFGKVTIIGGEDTGLVENLVVGRVLVRNGTGDVLLSNNILTGTTDPSDMVVKNNAGSDTEVLIYGNNVSGNLQCEGNTVELATANVVDGQINCTGQE